MPVFNNRKRKFAAKPKPYFKKAKYSKKSKTSTKPKRTQKHVVSGPKKVATSHWNSTGGQLKGSKKNPKGIAVGRSHFTRSVCGRIEGVDASGPQAAGLMGVCYPRTDLLLIRGSLSDTTDALQYGSRVFLKTCVVTHLITNQSNTNIFIDLYDCVSKQDQGLTPEVTTQQTITDPLEAWNNGLVISGTNSFPNVGGQPLTAPTSASLGVTPSMSSQFRSLYKVMKKTVLCLAASETVQHQSVHSPNYTFDYSKTNLQLDDTSEEAYVKNLTCFTLLVVHGQPADLSNDGAVGMTIPEVNWSSSFVYKSHAYPFSKSVATLASTSDTPITRATAQVVRLDGGIVTQASA